MSNKLNFTKDVLTKLVPANKRYDVEDSKTPGLRLTVFPTGIKTFYLLKLIDGKSERIKLARLDDISIDLARKRATELKAQIVLGNNPRLEKEKKQSELKFVDLFNLYYSQHLLKSRKRAEDYRKLYDRQLHPAFGNKRLSEFTRSFVKKLHSDTSEIRGKTAANKTIAIISSSFNFGIANEYWNGANPCSHIKLFKPNKRDRFLSREELPAFFKALQKEESLFRDYFEVLLLTGARKMTVLSMRWDEIHFDIKQWRRDEKKSKNNEINIMHLTDRVVEILQHRKKENEQSSRPSQFVFPGSGACGHLVDPKKAFRRIKKSMGVKNIRIHDLRRTLGSYMAISGASLPIIGKALNHKSYVSTEIYARLSSDPIREAINKAEDLIREHPHVQQFKENSVFASLSKRSFFVFKELLT